MRVVLAGETRGKLLRNATPDSYSTEAEIIRRGAAALLVRASLGRGFRLDRAPARVLAPLLAELATAKAGTAVVAE